MEKESRFAMKSVYLQESFIVSPLGFGAASNFESLIANKSGISPFILSSSIGSVYAAAISDESIAENYDVSEVPHSSSRIERLAILALSGIVKKRKIHPNTVLILSTTKGNIAGLESESIDAALIPKMAKRIAKYFGFETDPLIVSNACTSGLLALSMAKRYIQMGMFEEAYLIAVDELTPFVVSGFQSFQAMSSAPCKPYDSKRSGINLGEAAVAAFVSDKLEENSILIAGDANINDANHISGPSRTGEGLYLSITGALKEAGIDSNQINYIVAHGTATNYNDEMEAIALYRAGLQNTPITGLKGYYGHTLAASGLLEAVITSECLKRNIYLATKGFEERGTSHPINVITKSTSAEIDIALKTASGFGGCNSAVILMKPHKR